MTRSTLFERMCAAARAPLDNSDRLPDEKAVWRTGPRPEYADDHRQVSLDLGGGLIERTTVGQAQWAFAARWRFGWAPKR